MAPHIRAPHVPYSSLTFWVIMSPCKLRAAVVTQLGFTDFPIFLFGFCFLSEKRNIKYSLGNARENRLKWLREVAERQRSSFQIEFLIFKYLPTGEKELQL